jgi:hypothetical protein
MNLMLSYCADFMPLSITTNCARVAQSVAYCFCRSSIEIRVVTESVLRETQAKPNADSQSVNEKVAEAGVAPRNPKLSNFDSCCK